MFYFLLLIVCAVPGRACQEAQLILLLCSNYVQDVKSELRLKIVPLNVTAFRDAGTMGLINGVISSESILKSSLTGVFSHRWTQMYRPGTMVKTSIKGGVFK